MNFCNKIHSLLTITTVLYQKQLVWWSVSSCIMSNAAKFWLKAINLKRKFQWLLSKRHSTQVFLKKLKIWNLLTQHSLKKNCKQDSMVYQTRLNKNSENLFMDDYITLQNKLHKFPSSCGPLSYLKCTVAHNFFA